MFLAAARALADFVTPEQIEQGQLYPEAKDLRKVAATVGTTRLNMHPSQHLLHVCLPCGHGGSLGMLHVHTHVVSWWGFQDGLRHLMVRCILLPTAGSKATESRQVSHCKAGLNVCG